MSHNSVNKPFVDVFRVQFILIHHITTCAHRNNTVKMCASPYTEENKSPEMFLFLTCICSFVSGGIVVVKIHLQE